MAITVEQFNSIFENFVEKISATGASFYPCDANETKLIDWIKTNASSILTVETLSAGFIALSASGSLEKAPVRKDFPNAFDGSEIPGRVNHARVQDNNTLPNVAEMSREILSGIKSRSNATASASEAAYHKANDVIVLPLDTPDSELRNHNVPTIKALLKRRAMAEGNRLATDPRITNQSQENFKNAYDTLRTGSR